ncbi:MAG: 5-oxoprolinase subunit PxpB [Acidisphaera sp.]|nr:5-oxoprolinase subunit PxpB [Acidisphaera sp.]MBV9813839.1 5-oxoprolinase subunit PxpB [Acetobacteraceae bacterium]
MTGRGPPSHALGSDDYPRLLPLGDAALSVEFGDAIDPAINARVTALDLVLAASELPGIVETVPSYRSLLVCYDPERIGWGALVAALRDLLRQAVGAPAERGRLWTVPVRYGPPYGEDLQDVAARCGMRPDEVIAAHSGVEFRVYLVGFAPGVPVLGTLPSELRVPRRSSPRPRVAAGSVVIAGAQASMLSTDMPSGWHVLGRTALRAYRPHQDNPFLFRPGDRVRFRPIGAETSDTDALARPEVVA